MGGTTRGEGAGERHYPPLFEGEKLESYETRRPTSIYTVSQNPCIFWIELEHNYFTQPSYTRKERIIWQDHQRA